MISAANLPVLPSGSLLGICSTTSIDVTFSFIIRQLLKKLEEDWQWDNAE